MADDSEDVNDFLKRIQELGTKRDQEDEERNRKLEEEILQGRKERQARRAERARSISPSKDFPHATPTHYQPKATEYPPLASRLTLSPAPDLQPITFDNMVEDAVDPLTDASSPTKGNTYSITAYRDDTDTGLDRTSSTRTSPSSAMPPVRSSTLSWQQRRPNSQASERSRSRPLSIIATENAARSPKATPESSPENSEHPPASRNQISQMLSSKDPLWFRQTPDRGENSPAYRKNQVEDNNVIDVITSSRVQLPGMSRESIRQAAISVHGVAETERSTSHSRNSFSDDSTGRSSCTGAMTISKGLGSPKLVTNAQKFSPPASDIVSSNEASGGGLALSPAKGRISPERMDRPPSPTKGMGGFVQSAMMKRSDSVNKRWGVQSPPGLGRGHSFTGNHTNFDATSDLNEGGKLARETRTSQLSRDNSPIPLSRPGSGHGNTALLQENEPSRTSNSTRSSFTASTMNEAFVKRPLSASESQVWSDLREKSEDHFEDLAIETPPPSSPSKMGNSGRWSPTKSPTKSSWLESALNKPASPKPKATPPLSQKPSWMAEINKARQRNANDLKNQPASKHEVKIGGLIRSPPLGGFAKPFGLGGLPPDFSSGSVVRNMGAGTRPSSKSSVTSSEILQHIDGGKSEPSTSLKPISNSPVIIEKKPESSPKNDFRANLKSRLTPSENTVQEPEFKNALGQLRRTKTQNYVAPDELKTNILRGKSELNVTGGPKKTERKDEFKEAILKKKEDFKKAQAEGTGVKMPESGRSQATATVPEALLQKAAMGKSSTPARGQNPVSEISNGTQKHGLPKESSIPGRLQSKEAVGSKLADRFNPALANMLARGPPSAASETSRSSTPVLSQRNTSTSTTLSTTSSAASEPGPQLTHMTKARARGPRRKAPSAIAATSETSTQSARDPEPRKVKSIPDPDIVSAIRISKVFEEVTPPDVSTLPKTSVQPAHDEPENVQPQPASPKKLDMKRRSRFLEEAPNKNEKTSQGLESSSKPLSPKKANLFENPVTSQEEEINAVDSKTMFCERTPSSPLKASQLPLPPSKSIFLSSGSPPQASQLPQHHTISPSKSVALSPEVKKPHPAPLLASKFKHPVPSTHTQDKVDSKSVVSVKNATALFGAQKQQSTTAVKVPIHLPTEDDENSAMFNVSLRAANVASGMKQDSRFGDAPQFIEEAIRRPKVDATTRDIGKPLPSPPSKSENPLLPSAEVGLMSPRKLQSQSSDASQVLTDFFGKHDFASSLNIDTSTILLSKPVEHAKIKTLRSQLFQLSTDGKKQAVPSHQERVLFEGNMYLCIHTFGTQTGKKIIEVYFWSGDAIPDSVVEDADLFARREARSAGGQLIKLCQGKETSEFIEALGGIMITRRGTSNKYDSLAPHILCGRRFAGQIVFDEVDFALSSLCSGFPYLVASQSGKCYLWKGKGSSIDELSCARLIGMDFGLMGDMEEVEDGNEPQAFLQVFGHEAKVMKSADHWRLKPSYQKYRGRLFCVDSSTEAQITEISPFSQADIFACNIYVLDAFFEIYIVVGARSQSQFRSFCSALLFAQEYGILAAGMEDRPFVPVSTVVLEGVPRDLKFVLRKWTDSLAPTVIHSPTTTLTRGRSLRVVPLNAALDAARF